MSSHRRLLIVLAAVPACLAATVWAQDARPQRRERESLTMSERFSEFRRTFLGGGDGESQSEPRSTARRSGSDSSGSATRGASSAGRSSSGRTAGRPIPAPSQQSQQRRPARLTDALFGAQDRDPSSATARRPSSPRQTTPSRTAGRQSAARPIDEPSEAAPQVAQRSGPRSSRRTFQPGYEPSAGLPEPMPTLATPPAEKEPAPRVASRPQATRRTPTPAPRIARSTGAAAREALREADETLQELDAEEHDGAAGATTESPSRGAASAALPRMTVDALDEPTASTNPDEFVVSRRGPEVRLETSGPRRLLVGKPAHYKVALVNSGDVPATDVAVTIELPAWADIVGTEATTGQAQPAAEATPGTFRWSVPTLKARSRQELKLEVVARQDREFELGVSWTSAPAEAVAKIEVRQARLELALAGPKEVSYGETSIFKLTFSNPGSADAENIVVRLLPLDAESAAAESHTLGRLAAGASKEVELELVARQQGQLKINIEATADGDLQVAVSEEVLVRRAGLQVAVEAPKFQYSGALATYNLTVSNPGDEPARNVRVTARLPRGATFVSSTDDGAHDEVAGQVAWELKSLEAGGQQVLTVRCTPTMSGPNQLAVDAAADGELTASVEETTEVEATADLVLEVRDPGGPMPVDEEVVYEVVVRNRGAKAATDIEVVGFFSNGIDPVKVEGGEYAIEDGKVLLSPLASLAAGDERVYRIKARAQFRGNHIFRAEVHCQTPESALAQEGTTRYYAADEDPIAAPVDEAATPPVAAPTVEPTAPADEAGDHAAESGESSANDTPTAAPAEPESTQFEPTAGTSTNASVEAADDDDEAAANKPARLGWRPRRHAVRAAETGKADEQPATGTLR